MQSRLLRMSVRRLAVVVAVAAVALFVIKLAISLAGPRYRMVEVIHRNPNGSITVVSRQLFNLDAPAAPVFYGLPDGEAIYRDEIARLKASGFEYRITSSWGSPPPGW